MLETLKHAITGREPESRFILEVTAACNNRCKYCYNIWKCLGQPPPPADLPSGEWAKIVEKLQRESSVDMIAISGGEPFLREDLPDILKDIKRRHIRVNLITNGTLLSEENISRTIDSVDLYELPLLGDSAAVHDSLTRSKAFDAVVNNMASISAAGGSFASVFVATKANAASMEGACLMAIALGARTIMYNAFNPGGDGLKHMEELQLPASVVTHHLDQLESLSQQYGIPIHCGVPILPCQVDIGKYRRITFGACPAGKYGAYYTIGPDGGMRMCNHSPVVLGDFRKEPFRKIKASAAADRFRRAVSLKCIGCPSFERCKGGCRAIAEQMYGGETTMHEPLSGVISDSIRR